MLCLSVCLSVCQDYVVSRSKRQEHIPIIFILFFTGFDFSRQTDVQIRTDGIEVIQDVDNAFLYLYIRNWHRERIQHRASNGRYRTLKYILLNIWQEFGFHIVKEETRRYIRCIYMDSVRSLVQCIFSLDIVVNLAYANTIARCYNCSFVIFIVILSQRLLRANKERILPIFNCFICIATARANICNFCQRSPLCLKCPPPCGHRKSKVYRGNIHTAFCVL